MGPLVACVGTTVAIAVVAIVGVAGGGELSTGGVAVTRHANRNTETMTSVSFVFILLAID
jgi:hypothetical protein